MAGATDKSSDRNLVVVGAAVGGLVVLVALVAIFVLWRRASARSVRRGHVQLPVVTASPSAGEGGAQGPTAFHNPLFFSMPGADVQDMTDMDGLYQEPAVNQEAEI